MMSGLKKKMYICGVDRHAFTFEPEKMKKLWVNLRNACI